MGVTNDIMVTVLELPQLVFSDPSPEFFLVVSAVRAEL